MTRSAFRLVAGNFQEAGVGSIVLAPAAKAPDGRPTRPPLDTFSNLNWFQNRVGGPVMLNQSRNPRGFGADDKPRCPNCGELTSLTRRAPAAEHALEYERQTFTCFGCERQF